MEKNNDRKITAISPNMKIGRWTVLEQYKKSPKGEKKWLCRCECGTEKYVLERSLKSGGSHSCGCIRKEKAREAVAYDLSGKTFGDLTVLHQTEPENSMSGIWWLCQCSCGNTYACPASLLVTGKRTHCGCKTNRGRPKDITGKRFHKLTALYMLPERDEKGSVIWHCRCDCGNEIDVAYNNLVFCNMKSCGCQKKEHDIALNTYLTHIAGTSLDMIKSKRIPKDNTTGYKGVYLIKGKYVAKIVFQRKAYYLGSYSNIEDAAEARRKAESVLFDEFADYYERYSQRAAKDRKWAEDNPIAVRVDKDGENLNVSFSPIL